VYVLLLLFSTPFKLASFSMWAILGRFVKGALRRLAYFCAWHLYRRRGLFEGLKLAAGVEKGVEFGVFLGVFG
jgi:hypothetical protein